MFTSLHLGRRIRPSTRARRSGAVLAAAVLAVGALSFAPPAQANLTAINPALNAVGFPTSYTDANGVSLDLCLDDANCIGIAADMVAPDGEAFYSSATAEVGGVVGSLDLEAAFLDADPIVFQRTQYLAPSGVFLPGQAYTITDPYGTETCVGNANTNAVTRCRIESGGGANVFSDALTGRIGPFLQSVSAPAGFIGDFATETKVVGSPTGFNKFRVQGPGLPINNCGVGCMQTDLWLVQGRFAGAAPAPVARQAVLPTTAIDLGSQPVANGPSAAKSATVVSNGTAPLTGIVASTGSAEFPVTTSCPASLPSAGECTVSVGFDPAAAGARTGSLTIASNGGTQVIPLSGRGTAGVMSVGPSAVDFGGTAVGSQQTRVVTVSNTGDAAMTFVGATLSGGQAGSFGLGGVASPACTAGATIAAGSSCQIGVTFLPTANGARSAALTVTSSTTSLLVALTGSGTGIDDVRPRLASRTPGAGARQVSRRTNVDVRFTETVRGVATSTFRLANARTGKAVRATVVRAGGTWRLDPARRLAGGTKYRVQLIGGPSAIRDLAGNALASQRWSFTTK